MRKDAVPKSIDEYLANVPEPARAALEKVRRAIRSAVPEASEGISYRMPVFRYKGRPLASLAAFRDHCSLIPWSAHVVGKLAAQLKGYEVTKGTVHFPFDKPLPASIVALLLKARMAELEGAPAKRKPTRKQR